jgi:hypothetical protein
VARVHPMSVCGWVGELAEYPKQPARPDPAQFVADTRGMMVWMIEDRLTRAPDRLDRMNVYRIGPYFVERTDDRFALEFLDVDPGEPWR